MTLYRNTRFQRVRGLQYGFWIVAAAFLGAWLVLPFAAPVHDATVLLILSPIMAAVALGMEVYRGLYVTRVEAAADALVVEVLGFRGRVEHRVPWAGIAASGQQEYRARAALSTAVMLRRPGARLPFIVDTTADAFDTAALARLVRRPPRPSGPPASGGR